jgi:acetolactate synthase-1/2/3 large subunit
METNNTHKYSDLMAEWLSEIGYTHVFFVAGGNIMHLIESLSHKMTMVPVINEIATTISAEYFNEANLVSGKKALALVTAGPGITNAITGIAGAYLESRELLVIGGQVKSSDLSDGSVRQSGIQEIGGVELVSSISCKSILISRPISKSEFTEFVQFEPFQRKGPIFLEICLDVQAKLIQAPEELGVTSSRTSRTIYPDVDFKQLEAASELLRKSKRPVFLIGSGVDIQKVPKLIAELVRLEIPVMTSWNAADRVSSDNPFYFGRPNNWGQRSSNIILQQADLLIAAGTRLGFQATGFNVDEFLPVGQLVHIDIDRNEIFKGHPKVHLGIVSDGFQTSMEILKQVDSQAVWKEWVAFSREVRKLVPVVDPENTAASGYVEIFSFIHTLSTHFGPDDVIIPSSSGGGSTVPMQVIKQKGLPQRIITNKGMASMGYGICGAIGAAFAGGNRVWFVDGDGSFTQNIQELGVMAQFNLDVKIFIISNEGYASIRSTQRNYFSGNYIGCDPSTGLNLPNWKKLADAYGVAYFKVNPDDPFDDQLKVFLKNKGPALIEVPVDPNQTFFPKIASRISETKGMESNPLHLMTPDLDFDTHSRVFQFLKNEGGPND